MDSRLRALERAAASGDEEAKKAYILLQCRSYGHDWEMKDVCISTFPINYKTVPVRCKRCGYLVDDSEPRKKVDSSIDPVQAILNRYAYGTVADAHRQMDEGCCNEDDMPF